MPSCTKTVMLDPCRAVLPLIFTAAFIAQLRNVVAAVRGDEPLLVSGEDGLQSLTLIEHCYRPPYVDVDAMAQRNRIYSEPENSARVEFEMLRVAVLGANGFIGNRTRRDVPPWRPC